MCLVSLGLFAKMRQNDVHKNGLFGHTSGQKDKIQAASARRRCARDNLAFLRVRVCVFGLIVALYRKMWQNHAHNKGLFLAAPPAKKDKTHATSARRRRARENLAFLRLQVCVFGLNFALNHKMRHIDAHRKGLFLATPPAKKD